MLALKQIESHYNAAEVESVHIRKCLGFRIAKVTLHARHIQQQASFGIADEKPLLPFALL